MAWSAPSAIGTAATSSYGAVTPALPTHSAGHHLFAFMVGRVAGITYTCDDPGYTQVLAFDGIALWAKVAGGSESAPTFTPAGGTTGDSIVAFMFAATGGETNLASLLAHSATNNNSNPQINTPALTVTTANCLILWMGRKADDDTMTAPSGATAIVGQANTTLGNDITGVCAYVIQTTASNISSSSFGSTTGLSGSNRSAVVALKMASASISYGDRSIGRGMFRGMFRGM